MKYMGGILIKNDRGYAMSTGDKILFPTRGQELTEGFVTDVTETIDKGSYGFMTATQLTGLSKRLNIDALVKLLAEHDNYSFYECYLVNGVEVAVMKDESNFVTMYSLAVTTDDGDYHFVSNRLEGWALDKIIKFLRGNMYIQETTYSDRNSNISTRLHMYYTLSNAEDITAEDAMIMAVAANINKTDNLYLVDNKYAVVESPWNDKIIYYDKHTKRFVSLDATFSQLKEFLPAGSNMTLIDAKRFEEFRKEWLLADIRNPWADDYSLIVKKDIYAMGTWFKFSVVSPRAIIDDRNIKYADLAAQKERIDSCKKDIEDVRKTIGRTVNKYNIDEFSMLSLYNILTL